MSEPITPFTIETPQAALDDLTRRLRATRWPERETVDDWSQGIPLDYVRQICEHWAEGYDWRVETKTLDQHIRSPRPLREVVRG